MTTKQEEKKNDDTQQKSLSVIYFPFASQSKSGRGITLRVACILGGLCWEDRIVHIHEHFAQKRKGQRRWTGVPEMIVYNKQGQQQRIAQSSTCLRYIGVITGLYPKNEPLKCGLIDEIIDSIEDIVNHCFKKMMWGHTTYQVLMNNDNGKLRYWFDKFELRFKENEERGNDNGYIVGNELSIADIRIYGHFRNYVNGSFIGYGVPQTIFIDNGYKRISNHVNKMMNNKKIVEFINQYEKRVSSFKYNGKERTKIYDGKLIYGDF